MEMLFKRTASGLLCILFIAGSVYAAPAKKPAPPKGPDKTSAEYLVDNSLVQGYKVEFCPAKKAFELFQKKTKVKINFSRIRPNQERSVSIDIRRAKLRAALNEFKKYGYVWRATGKNITIYPVGKPEEWKTGFGSLNVMDGNAAWITRARVRNAHFNNVPFAEVEKFLRKQKYKVAGVGKTNVRVTLSAGNVSLKQLLSALCIATGFDCVVNKQQITFRKGPGIGYFTANNKYKDRLVKIKYPVVSKPLPVSDFLRRADASTAWVFLHIRGVDMAYYKTVVPVDVSGITTSDALDLLEKNLNIRVLSVENNVMVLIPHPGKARSAMRQRMKAELTGLQYTQSPLKKVLDDIQKQSVESDRNRQGIPMFVAGKLNDVKVSIDLPSAETGELLRRLTLATGHYGYISSCGTCYVLVKSGLYHFKGITITQLSPVMLAALPAGVDCVDIPLDFEAVEFKNVSVENILKFLKVLGSVRFGERMTVTWGVNPETLRKNLSFKVEQPTLRSMLDALSLRTRFHAEVKDGKVTVKDY